MFRGIILSVLLCNGFVSVVPNENPVGRPVFIRRPRDVYVHDGSTVELECVVRGNPRPYLYWFKEHSTDFMFPGFVSNKTSVTDNGTLIIKDLQRDDTGIYTCTALNVEGTISTSAHVEVTVADDAPSFARIPEDQHVNIGDRVRLDCKAKGQPKPTIFWSREEDESLMFPGFTSGRISVLDNGTLNIQHALEVDAGIYTCEAMNKIGRASTAARVVVRRFEEPTMIKVPLDRRVSNGSTVKLECKATGTPSPIIFWTKGSQSSMSLMLPGFVAGRLSVSDDGILIIRDAREEDSGVYTCRANNRIGTTRPSNVHIIVRAPDIDPSIRAPGRR